MKFKIENRYCAAKNFFNPPCTTLSRERFIEHLSNGIPYVAMKDPVRTNVYKSHVRIAKLYLEKYSINELVPDEAFFLQLWNRLKVGGEVQGDLGQRKYSPRTTQRAVRGIREIVNKYFFSQGIISRPILLGVEHDRYKRFFDLTPQSQKAIVWFEENGKIVKSFQVMILTNGKEGMGEQEIPMRHIPRIMDKKLLPYTNSQKIWQALRFLDIVGKKGFELVNDQDVEKFKAEIDRRELKKKNDYLGDVATFYINIKSAGFVSTNPFKDVSLKKDASSVRIDYIPQQGIDRLFDLSNLNMENPVEVRNRLMCFFCYDAALRIAETASLNVSDLQKDSEGEWCLLLKPESQKGRDKAPFTMYFYFEKTKQLLDHYLTKIRPKFRPRDDALFLSSQTGRRGALQASQAAVAGHLGKSGIKTCYGNKATAHHLRHSFGTLNIEPLGISLPAHEISYRYRHTRLEITMRIYVHNNPELIKQKHRAIQSRHKKTHTDILDNIPLSELEHWLNERLGVSFEIIRAIRKSHREVFAPPKLIDKKVNSPTIPSQSIDSTHAKEVAAAKGISFRFLKNYCLGKGLLYKVGRSYRFDTNFITDLEGNWMPFQRAMEKLKIPERSFYRVVREKKWPTLRLGKKLFIEARKLNLLEI